MAVPLDLSVITAAHNEQDNVTPLIEEIVAALDPLDLRYEIIAVDDGSTDGTAEALRRAGRRFERLRVLSMLNTPTGRGLGQSAAFAAGIRAASGELVALLDADLQNDPADLPILLARLTATGADMVQGDRRASRADGLVRRASSAIGRVTRRLTLGDTISDTGCSLRVLKREAALRLPLEYRGMHRFIPITCRQLGYTVVEHPVRHRARRAGDSKYGIFNRAIPGLIDCLAVRWMRGRRRPIEFEERTRSAAPDEARREGSP